MLYSKSLCQTQFESFPINRLTFKHLLTFHLGFKSVVKCEPWAISWITTSNARTTICGQNWTYWLVNAEWICYVPTLKKTYTQFLSTYLFVFRWDTCQTWNCTIAVLYAKVWIGLLNIKKNQRGSLFVTIGSYEFHILNLITGYISSGILLKRLYQMIFHQNTNLTLLGHA